MDVEEGIIRLIYSKDELKNSHYSASDVQQYLQQLGSCGLEKLGKEPDRIAEERASVISQTQELAFQNYPTFIETANCTKEISSDFKKINSGTEKLSGSLKTLKGKCMEFSETAQSLSAARRLTSLALSRHTQLLEVLELPQLMDTCVRNGYWEEALELSAHVVRLERKLGYIPLIVNIAREVQSCTRLMLSQLIAQLRMPAQLPHCLKVVGYLRRMGVFSEEELRLKFLQARDAWFRSTLEEIPKEDAYQHVLKTIDLSRVNLFDIATQYRAIFTDEDPLVLANQDSNINDSAIFHSWIIQKVTDFMLTLQSDLPKVAASSLESVFGHCMYFGLSFSRIGSDFRALLVPLFAQVVYDRFDQSTNRTEAQFAESMASFSLLRNASSGPTSVPAATSTADQIQPPPSLLKFPPLANLCNGIIAAFNELRLYAPVQLVDPVTRKLERTLHSCSQVIADFHRHEKEVMTPTEEQEFSKCLDLFWKDFLEYIQKILHLMFPPSLLCVQTGFTSNEVQRQSLVTLDRDMIVKPIHHLLPAVDMDKLIAVDAMPGAVQFPAEPQSEPLEEAAQAELGTAQDAGSSVSEKAAENDTEAAIVAAEGAHPITADPTDSDASDTVQSAAEPTAEAEATDLAQTDGADDLQTVPLDNETPTETAPEDL